MRPRLWVSASAAIVCVRIKAHDLRAVGERTNLLYPSWFVLRGERIYFDQ